MLSRRLSVLMLMLVTVPLAAQSGRGGQRPRSGPGTGNPDEHLAPWHYLEIGAPLVKAPVVLYWLPATEQEVERSPLLTSRELLEAATARCVGLEIVLPDDPATIEKLGATGRLPSAVLLDVHGNVTRRIDGPGAFRPGAVEQMVRDELGARDERVYTELTEARKRISSGDKDGAIGLYRKIWDDRCLFPLVGREAQRALASLGVTVVEPPPTQQADPNLARPAKTATHR